jgi:four helix bundle protein
LATVKRFEDLQAWQKARALVREIYKHCSDGGLRKDFGLRDQLCRGAVSCMTNIAEGFARKTDKDFAHFLDVAKGSAVEIQSLLYVASDVGYIQPQEFSRLYNAAEEVAALIGGLASYLRQTRRAPVPRLSD